MRRSCCVLLLCLALAPARAEPPPKLSAAELAAKIDEHVAARWRERKVTPAPVADDAEIVRRLHLDVLGRIPDIVSARDFIDDPAKDKRAKLVEKLLADERYALHWANVWRGWLLPENTEQQFGYVSQPFEAWLREELRKNTSCGKMTHSLLTGTNPGGGVSPFTFLFVFQGQPERAAAAVSRRLLGVRLECAQCHNHPFSDWKRQQFWEFAAFFAGMNPQYLLRGGLSRPAPAPTGQIKIPGTDKVAKARFLGAKEDAKWTGDPRSALADWVVAKDNPFFARFQVNRVWEHLLGAGFTDPIEDEGTCNAASHPALLGLIAQQFTLHDYDLKYLIKSILLTSAYQLTSRQTDPSQADAAVFARRKVRGLSPEQLYDSLAVATGQPEEYVPPAAMVGRGAYPVNPTRADFLRRFPSPDRRAEQQTSILQALYLMHGKIVADATSLVHNRNLAVIAEGTSVRTPRRVEQLFLITLSRKPTAAESARLVKYVDAGGPTRQPAQALCDVFWALLNSSEFCANH